MSFLKEMSAAVGVGNLEVTVACEDELHLGDEVHGVATITGGQVPQLVQGLVVTLASRWEVRDGADQREGEGARPLHHRAVPAHIDVAPGSVHRVPFVLDIPLDAPLAEPGDWHSVDVRADIPAAVDVTGSRRVSLLPARPIAAALRAIVATGEWTLDGYEPRKARDGFARAVLSPGPAMAARFDRVYLEMALENGLILVDATLDLKERFWREITGRDKRELTFTAADVPALVARFREIIDEQVSAA